MKSSSLLVATLCLAGTATSQFTSPAGYLTTEGSSNHDYILFKYDLMRWQQLDDTSVGQAPMQASRISWRRDGTNTGDATWFARTMDIEVILSESVPAAGVSVNQDANYLNPGAPTTVFTMKPVNLPDWTAQPGTTPAPFDLVLPLDTPWVYTAQNSYLWEVRTRNNTSASDYGNDFQSISGSRPSINSGTNVGTGCVTTGNTAAMTLSARAENQISRFRIDYELSNAPMSTGTFLNLDFVNSNLTIPGLCTTVVAVPTLNLFAGTTDVAGDLQFGLENIPPLPGLAGATVFSQALAIDPNLGLGVALSNGEQNTFPSFTGTPVQTTRVYGYQLTNGSMRAPSAWTGGIVTRFD